MAKKHIPSIAAALTAVAALTSPAAAEPAHQIICNNPVKGGTQRMEAYQSAPGEMSVWYTLHAHIKIFEPLIRGTPIDRDNVHRAYLPAHGMHLNFHTVDNRGYATMSREDFQRVFSAGPANPGLVPFNDWRCTSYIMNHKPRIIPFDPRSFSP